MSVASPRLRRSRILAAAVAATLALAAGARAQEESSGPVFGAREKPPIFGLDPIHGNLAFLAQQIENSNSYKLGSNAGSSKSSETYFRETATLNTTGYIVHPNLVDLRLSGTFGLSQNSFDGGSGSQNEDDTLYAWDVMARILKNQDITLSLYTRQTQQLVNRDFGPTLQDTETTYGADLTLKSKVVPTTVRAYHTEQVQTSLDGSEDFSLTQDVVEWHSEYRPTDSQQLTWDYHYAHSEQSAGRGPAETIDNQSGVLTHSVDFGSRHQHNLTSTLDFSQQDGLISYEHLRWDELLHLRHTENFETNYEYTLEQLSIGDIDQTSQRGIVGFQHRLYDSLVTNGRLGLSEVDLSDGSSVQDAFASLDMEYNKKVPFGRLTSFLGFNFDTQDSAARSDTVTVIDQPFTFQDPEPIVIPRPDLLPNTIILTDAKSGRIYRRGVDYRVLPRADGFQLYRTIGGPIPNNEPVLVDYQLSPESANTITTDTISFGTRYTLEEGFLKGLSVYGRYSITDQSISSTGPINRLPDSSTDLLYGAEYRFWDVILSAEQEHNDSELVPFDATRLRARTAKRIGFNTVLGLDAAYTMMNYPLENNQVNYATFTATVEHRLTRELSLLGSLGWTDIEDNLAGNSEGLEEQVELRWKHRQLSVLGLIRNATLDSDTQENNFLLFQVGLQRDF